jgi:hypothetical protein
VLIIFGDKFKGTFTLDTTAFLSVTYNVIRFKQRFYAPEKLVALLHRKVAETELRYTRAIDSGYM